MRRTGLRPTRVISYKKFDKEDETADAPLQQFITNGIDAFPVKDQGLCEGCYAWAIADCISYNCGSPASAVDILQAYDDTFMGCEGGHVAGTAFETYMADVGVALLPSVQETCDPSCFLNPSESISLNKTIEVCDTRPDLVHQTCTKAFYFSACCWPARSDKIAKSNWVSTNNERLLQNEMQSGSTNAAVMTLALGQEFFSHPQDAPEEEPSGAWVPLRPSVRMGDIDATWAFVPTNQSFSGEMYYHAVVVLGWVYLGEEDVPGAPGLYWWAKNTWSDEWADKGMFLIAASSNTPTSRKFAKNRGIIGGKVDGVDMIVSYPSAIRVEQRPNSRSFGTSTQEMHTQKVNLQTSWAIVAVSSVILIAILAMQEVS